MKNVVAPTVPLKLNTITAVTEPGKRIEIPWHAFAADSTASATITLEGIETQPTNGTASIVDGNLYYKLNRGANSDSLVVELLDSLGNTATGQITIEG